MGFEGGSLEHAIRRLARETRDTSRHIVRAEVDNWRDVTVRNTPIETFLKSVSTKPPYHLRYSWEIKRLQVFPGVGEDAEVIESGLYTEVEYAPYVEEGTGLWGPEHKKYVIRPKRPGGWLSWIARDFHVRKDGSVIKPGDRVFAKEVLHPGSPGAHMLAIGMHMTEAEFEQVAQPLLREWERRGGRALERGWRSSR